MLKIVGLNVVESMVCRTKRTISIPGTMRGEAQRMDRRVPVLQALHAVELTSQGVCNILLLESTYLQTVQEKINFWRVTSGLLNPTALFLLSLRFYFLNYIYIITRIFDETRFSIFTRHETREKLPRFPKIL